MTLNRCPHCGRAVSDRCRIMGCGRPPSDPARSPPEAEEKELVRPPTGPTGLRWSIVLAIVIASMVVGASVYAYMRARQSDAELQGRSSIVEKQSRDVVRETAPRSDVLQESAPDAQSANKDTGHGGPAPYLAAARLGNVTPPDIVDVENMCALLTSCRDLPFPPAALPNNESTCVNSFMKKLTSPDAVKFPLPIRECALQANSCADLRSCALRGASPDACKGWGRTSAVGRCDPDGRAINCLHEQVVGVRDCSRVSESCYVHEGQASCVLGPCTAENPEGAPATCSASGDRVLKCKGGELMSVDCAAFGLACTLDNGRPGCAPATTPTCTTGAKRCEGNVAIGCEHGHEIRVDCGAVALVCNSVPGAVPVGSCMAPPVANASDECDPKAPPTCDGTVLKYCFAGYPRSYFCRTMGFDGCVQQGSTARCR